MPMSSLCDTLMKTHKDSLTIYNDMQNIKQISDDLALISYFLFVNELVFHTLKGLGNDFKEIGVVIHARDTPMSFEELYDKLLDQRTSLKWDKEP